MKNISCVISFFLHAVLEMYYLCIGIIQSSHIIVHLMSYVTCVYYEKYLVTGILKGMVFLRMYCIVKTILTYEKSNHSCILQLDQGYTVCHSFE